MLVSFHVFVTNFFGTLIASISQGFRSERAQAMVEYALVLVLIAVVVLAVLMIVGNQVQNAFCNIAGVMGP